MGAPAEAEVPNETVIEWVSVMDHKNKPKIRCEARSCGNRLCRDKSDFARHVGNAHPQATEAMGLVQCVVCNRWFVGDLGLARHIGDKNSACGDSPPGGAPGAAANAGEGAGDGDGEDDEIEGDDGIDLLKHFHAALFHVHRAWQESLFAIVMHLLTMMVSADAEVRLRSTTAFYILPGIVTYVKNSETEARPAVVLQEMLGLPSDSDGIAKRVIDMAKKLKQRQQVRRGQAGLGPGKSAVQGLVDRIEQAGRDGQLSMAAEITNKLNRVLGGDAVGPERLNLTPAERDAVVAKLHPPRRSAELDDLPATPMDDEPAGLQITGEAALEGIRKLNSKAAPGVSGWTNNLLKWLRVYAGKQRQSAELGKRVAAVANRALRGEIDGKELEFFTRYRLYLKPKDGGGVRPLGLGDVLMRLILRISMRSASEGLGKKFAPTQLGVGVRGGCEIGYNTMEQCWHREAPEGAGSAEESAGVLANDVVNAYNTLSVAEAYGVMKKKAPALIRVFRILHGEPTTIVDAGREIIGQRMIGTVQGNPMGGAVCACGMEVVSKRMEAILDEETAQEIQQRGHTLPAILGLYADDTNIGASLGVLCRVAVRLQEEAFAPSGLAIAPSKSHLSGKRVLELPPGLAPAGFRLCPEGVKILGGPVGTDEFKRSFLEMRRVEMTPPYLALPRISVRLAFALILHHYNARATFLTRIVKPELSKKFCHDFDEAIDRAAGQILGIRLEPHAFALPPGEGAGAALQAAYRTARETGQIPSSLAPTLRGLPARHGGLGLTRLSGFPTEKGYACSQATFREFKKEHRPELEAVPLPFSLPNSPPLGAVLEDERHMVPLEFEEAEVLAGGTWEEVAELATEVQARLVARTTTGILAALHEQGRARAGGDVYGRASEFVSNGQQPAAGLWCRSLVGMEGGNMFFPNPAFCRAIGHRLLEPLPQSEEGPLEVCACCLMIGAPGHVPEAWLTKQFSHAMSCGGVNLYTVRYTKLQELLAGLIRNHMQPVPDALGVVPQVTVQLEREVEPERGRDEERGPAGAPGRERGKKMDIVVRVGEAKSYWIDVSVVEPASERYRRDGGYPNWPPKPLAAAGRREVEKLQDLQRKWPGFVANGANVKYVPFVLEATGAVGMQAQEFFKYAGISGEAVRGFMGQVSILLARYGGRMLAKVHAKSVEYQRMHPRGARRGRAGALA